MSSRQNPSALIRETIGSIGGGVRDVTPKFFKFFAKLPILAQRSVKLVPPFAVLIAVTFAPLAIDEQIKYAVAIFLCISMLWTLGALPLPVTALLVPVLLTFYGVFPTSEALRPFADPVVYLLMGGLIIAEAFRKHGIDRRLAYGIAARFGGDIGRTLLSLMIVAAILSMWRSNTATVGSEPLVILEIGASR